jgi:hypothetical protein
MSLGRSRAHASIVLPMKYIASLLLLSGLASTALANTFRLECVDAYDGNTRLALIEVDTDAASVRIYSAETHGWKDARDVAITDSTITYVEHGIIDSVPVVTTTTINRVTGKYFAYLTHAPRKDGQCKKVSSDLR